MAYAREHAAGSRDDAGRGRAREAARTSSLTIAQLALGMAIFGSATPIAKIVTGALPVFLASGLRVALGALTLAPVALRRRSELGRMSARSWWRTAAISIFGMFGFSVLMLHGMQRTSGVMGAVVMSTTPAVTALGAIVFLHERATWRKLLAVGLAVGGVVLLQASGSAREGDARGEWLGAALVFLAVCCEAAYTLLGRQVSQEVDPLWVAFLASVMAVPLFIPFAVREWSQFEPALVDTRTWLALAWYGAGTLAVGSWLWYSGIRKAQGSVAAGFMGVMPVSALVLSYLLLGERFAWMHLAGFGLVLAGVVVISWEHARMEASESTPSEAARRPGSPADAPGRR